MKSRRLQGWLFAASMCLLVAVGAACARRASGPPPAMATLDSLKRRPPRDSSVWVAVADVVTRGDSTVAGRAAELLAHAGPVGLFAIRRLLRQPDSRSRRLGAYALGSLGAAGRPAVAELIPLMGGTDQDVANMADWSLTRLALEHQPPLLTLARGLRYGAESERIEAAQALKLLGPGVVPVCPLLIRHLADSSPAVRAATFAALDRAGAAVLDCLRRPRGDGEGRIRTAILLLRSGIEDGGFGR